MHFPLPVKSQTKRKRNASPVFSSSGWNPSLGWKPSLIADINGPLMSKACISLPDFVLRCLLGVVWQFVSRFEYELVFGRLSREQSGCAAFPQIYTQIGYWNEVVKRNLPRTHFLTIDNNATFTSAAGIGAFPYFVSNWLPHANEGVVVRPVEDMTIQYWLVCLRQNQEMVRFIRSL